MKPSPAIWALLLALFFSLLSASSPLGAQTTVRFGVGLVGPTSTLDLEQSGSFAAGPNQRFTLTDTMTVDTGNAGGLMVSGERRLGASIGIEFSALALDLPVTARGIRTTQVTIIDPETGAQSVEESAARIDSRDELGVAIVGLGFNLHVGTERADLYLGPFLGFARYDDFTFDGSTARLDDDFTLGASAGFDRPFGSGGWSASVTLRYLDLSAGPEAVRRQVAFSAFADPLDIDPLVLQLGLSRRVGARRS